MRDRRRPNRPESPDDPPISGGTITAISRQRRDPERVSVFLDGAFAFGLGAELALREGLRVGEALDPARVESLLAADTIGKATNAAINLLAHRPRSEREIRDRLRQKGYTAEAIEAAVERLYRWNYLDDAAFARGWVANRAANSPRGGRLLAQELWRKGVDRETVAETLADAELDEADDALTLGRAKLRSYAGLEPAVARRRLAAYLARRGYGYETIRPVLDRLLASEDDERASESDWPDE